MNDGKKILTNRKIEKTWYQIYKFYMKISESYVIEWNQEKLIRKRSIVSRVLFQLS